MYIIDTDIISIFAKVKKLDLLLSISPKINITPMIKEELSIPLINGYNFPLRIFEISEIVVPAIEEIALFEELHQYLGRGESEAIAIAKQRDFVFITNDRKALMIAEKLGVLVLDLQSLMRVLYLQKALSEDEVIKFFEELKIKDNFKMNNSYLASILSEE